MATPQAYYHDFEIILEKGYYFVTVYFNVIGSDSGDIRIYRSKADIPPGELIVQVICKDGIKIYSSFDNEGRDPGGLSEEKVNKTRRNVR